MQLTSKNTMNRVVALKSLTIWNIHVGSLLSS